MEVELNPQKFIWNKNGTEVRYSDLCGNDCILRATSFSCEYIDPILVWGLESFIEEPMILRQDHLNDIIDELRTFAATGITPASAMNFSDLKNCSCLLGADTETSGLRIGKPGNWQQSFFQILNASQVYYLLGPLNSFLAHGEFYVARELL